MSTRFQYGPTYWPRRTGYHWWLAFDRNEFREDAQHIAAQGMNHVRICLPWEVFQPSAQRMDTTLLRSLERVLDEVADAGLQAIVTLFPVAVGGALFVPRWVANPDPLNDLLRTGNLDVVMPTDSTLPQVVYEGRYHTSHARDLFRDSSVIEAQRYQINEVIGYFGAHPAAALWQLGDGLERVYPPISDDAIAAWFTTMAETAHQSYAAARLLGVTSTAGLLRTAGPRPEALAANCDVVGITVDMPLPLTDYHPERLEALEFIHTLASALAEQPMAVVGLGLPTAPDNRPQRYIDTRYEESVQVTLVSGQMQADYLGRALEYLQAARAPLVVLADYHDYPASLWRDAPLDRAIATRSIGLNDAGGREKPVSDTVQAFAHASLPETVSARSTLAAQFDPERYWHDPTNELARLWREFMLER